jgi:hypothetical protein
MWYRGQSLCLFVEDGVYLAPKDYPSTAFMTRVWTLVDADEGKCVPEFLAVQDTQHMNIFASSPKQERWQGMSKTTEYAVAIMNPWTRAEISKALAHLLLPSMFELTVLFCVALLFVDFQPTPRL